MPWTFRGAPFLVAGPCVVEPGDIMPRVAERLAGLGVRLGIPVCFKASVDKANRARGDAPRGPGFEAGLRLLERVRRESGLPVLTDIHEPGQAALAAEVADALQVPAFLCRQTDLLVAAGRTGRPVNIKKGQWMAPEAMAGAAEKVRAAGGMDLAVTERGTSFGYGDLVVDMRSFARLREACLAPVLFDATHAVQQPGQGAGGATGGQREHIPALLLAAAAAGADGFFLETHPAPDRAPSDGATQWPLDQLEPLVERALDVWHAARVGRGATASGRRGPE
ncbi:MAG: 3-deoxy-8-phosphooctulonate synthase [Gemmatimonadetes bacterium]|nr:3-deoxy-8-phosphooctulonate synthase [Gemmatimonadota bacterium]